MSAFAVWAVLALVAQVQEPSPEAEAFLSAYSAERDGLETLQARFVQWTYTPDEDIKSEGTVTYVRPKRIIFRYDDPPLSYMIDGTHAYEYDEELEQILVYDIEGQPEAEAFFMGMESDIGEIRKAYQIHVLPPDDAIDGAHAVRLTPHPNDDLEPLFEHVTLQLRKQDYLPTQILIRNDEDSRVEYTLTGFEKNGELAEDTSQILVKEGSDIVINDVALDRAGPEGHYFPDADLIAEFNELIRNDE